MTQVGLREFETYEGQYASSRIDTARDYLEIAQVSQVKILMR